MTADQQGRQDSRPDPETTSLQGIPLDWETVPLGQVCVPSREAINPGAYPDEPFEYYSIPAFQETGGPTITLGQNILSQKLLVSDGTVLFGKLNPRVPKVWRVRARTSHRKLASTEFLALVPGERLDGEFLTFLCWSSHVMEVSRGLVSGSTPSRQRVAPASFYEIPVPVPPLPEQRAVAAVLAKIQAAVEVQEKIVATLKELKAATMAKLFREGLRGEPLKQTEVGELPESWEVIGLAELCAGPDGFIQTGPFGSQLHASDYVLDGVPSVNPTHIDDGRIRHAEIPRVSASDAARLQRHKLRLGDILFSRRGDVGRHGYVFEEEEGWLCGTGCLIVRASRGTIDPLYLSYFLGTAFAQEYLKAKAVGSIMPNINTKILASVPVPKPAHTEQLRIAEILRRLDDSLESAIARRKSFQALFSAMLHLLMTGEVRLHESGLKASGVSAWSVPADLPGALGGGTKQFVAELVRRFGPERVVLFGPHVEGSPRAFGEVGLLVEMEFEGLARDQAARMAHEIPHDFSLDLVVRRPEDVARAVEMGDAFIKGVLERGRTLHVRPSGAPARREKAPRRETPPRRGRVSEETLREIVQRIVETVQPERIILFGSAARGEMGPDSDIDLMVVKACADRRETARTISWHLIGVAPGLPKDVIVVTPEDVDRNRDTIGLIIRPALREGRVVYAA